MKNYFILLCCFASSTLYGASTTAAPFEFEFTAPLNRMTVIATLNQSCRYERIVWSDSAEYEVSTKSYPLVITIREFNGEEHYRVSSPVERYHEVRGIFRPTKECKSELTVEFFDKNYAIGWAGQMERPLKFSVATNHYYQEGDQEFDPSKVLDLLEKKVIEFYYVPVASQVNVWLTANGLKLPNAPISTAKNPKTNMPYPLRQKF